MLMTNAGDFDVIFGTISGKPFTSVEGLHAEPATATPCIRAENELIVGKSALNIRLPPSNAGWAVKRVDSAPKAICSAVTVNHSMVVRSSASGNSTTYTTSGTMSPSTNFLEVHVPNLRDKVK